MAASTVELTIKKELRELIDPPTEEQRAQLEKNILAEGRIRDKLIYWVNGDKNILVDGMTRYSIAKSHPHIPYECEEMKFKDIEEVKQFIEENALGRRNMNPQAERRVRGSLYNRLKGQQGGDQKSNGSNGHDVPLIGQKPNKRKNAAKEVAKKAGVSPRTVRRDGKFVESLEKIPRSLQEGIEKGQVDATDAAVAKLAKCDTDTQLQVAREVRTGEKDLSKAMDKAGVKVPTTKSKKCPIAKDQKHKWVADGNGERYCEECKEDHPDNKKAKPARGKAVASAAKLVDELTRAHVGKLVRGIDLVAKANGGIGPVHAEANKQCNELIKCLKKMRAGEQ